MEGISVVPYLVAVEVSAAVIEWAECVCVCVHCGTDANDGLLRTYASRRCAVAVRRGGDRSEKKNATAAGRGGCPNFFPRVFTYDVNAVRFVVGGGGGESR